MPDKLFKITAGYTKAHLYDYYVVAVDKEEAVEIFEEYIKMFQIQSITEINPDQLEYKFLLKISMRKVE